MPQLFNSAPCFVSQKQHNIESSVARYMKNHPKEGALCWEKMVTSCIHIADIEADPKISMAEFRLLRRVMSASSETKRADQLAKQGITVPQPDNSVILSSARNTIESCVTWYTKNHFKEFSVGRRWKALAVVTAPKTRGYGGISTLHRPRVFASPPAPYWSNRRYFLPTLPLSNNGRPHLQRCDQLTELEGRMRSCLYWEA